MAEKVPGSILTSEGIPKPIETILLTDDEAKLLRSYRLFLKRHHLYEALFCDNCAQGGDVERASVGQPHGCRAYVTSTDISILCRCRNRFYRGGTA